MLSLGAKFISHLYTLDFSFQIPPGVWAIYNTREICCGVNSPFSSVCNNKGPNGELVTPKPTKAPTILILPDVPDTEDVTLKFALTGLPNDADVTALKTNVLAALKIILAQLVKRVPDLQVVDITERVCKGRSFYMNRQLRVVERKLRDATVCYDVKVMNSDDGQDYETLIVTEVMDSYEVILDQIRTKLNYVNVGMNRDQVGAEEGNSGSNPGTLSANGGDGGGGLPGWGVALIVIMLLIFGCCIGYCIFVSARNRRDEKEAATIMFNNNAASRTGSRSNNPRSQYSSATPRRRSFADRGGALRKSFHRLTGRPNNVRDRPRRRDDGSRRRRNRYSDLRSSFTGVTSRATHPRRRRRRSRDTKSRREHDDYPSISLSNPQDPKFGADEFTVNTYGTKKKNIQDPPKNFQDPPMYALTMPVYEPDYSKPDPDGSTAGALVLAITNGDDNRRNYQEEPNTKPKLEPEPMLIEAAPIDRSRRSGRTTRRSESPPDPSVNVGNGYDQSQQEIFGRSGREILGRSGQEILGRSGQEMGDDDLEEYDQFGFRRDSQPQIYAPKRVNKRSEEWKESIFSFATEGPEDEKKRSKKSSKKHKKKHKKKEIRRGSSSESRQKYEEPNFTLESSERDKLYVKKKSGVDSVDSDVGSIDLESSASA
jgi:hypothetical protein